MLFFQEDLWKMLVVAFISPAKNMQEWCKVSKDNLFKVISRDIFVPGKHMYQDYISCISIKPGVAFLVICINITLLPGIWHQEVSSEKDVTRLTPFLEIWMTLGTESYSKLYANITKPGWHFMNQIWKHASVTCFAK